MLKHSALSLFLASFAASVGYGQTILFSDTFDRVAGTPTENGLIDGEPNPLASTSWGDNDNGLGGDIEQTYEIGPDVRGGNRHQYVDGDVARLRAGWSEIQYDFASDARVAVGGGLSIKFDATIADLTPGWLALSIGQTSAESTDEGDNNSVFMMVEDTVDLGLLFGGISGGGVPTILEVFEGDDFPDMPFTTAFAGDWGLGTDPNDEVTFEITIATDGFAVEAAAATANIFVTDSFGTFQVLSNYTFDWDADGEAYIGFSSNKDQGAPGGTENPDQEVQIDNLVISTLNTVLLGDGDYNEDGVVDAIDYTTWRDTLGQTVTPLSAADGDGDGEIGEGDYTVWANNYGSAPGIATAIPEPAAVMLLMVSCTGMLAMRQRLG